MGKKILILGNGFDLAHSLPTRYSNFLDFCYDAIFPKGNTIYEAFDKVFLDNIIKQLGSAENFMEKIFCFTNYIKENIWYTYLNALYKGDYLIGENWIDFESEIKYIIETIDRYNKTSVYSYKNIVSEMNNNLISTDKFQKFNELLICSPYSFEGKPFKDLRKMLYNDLEKLILALEIYLSFVEAIPIRSKSPNIFDDYDCIINFNYTNTYQRVYGECDDQFYIHGEINNDPNNMVLGIDEYWSEEERDNHTNFTIFKKFAQRIQKRTGIKSYEWIDEILTDYDENDSISEVFVFGHSLDVTDKDILCDYLKSEATSVTIYCKDKETEGEYIANAIKIIGEKRLLEKVNQNPSKLKFEIQQDMIPIEEKGLLAAGAAQ